MEEASALAEVEESPQELLAEDELAELMKLFDDHHTAALMAIYKEAMEAWEASKRPQKVITTKGTPQTPEEHREAMANATVVIRDSTGDPRYLQLAMQAMADIRKMWRDNPPG